MERLNILVTVLNGNAVAKAHTFHFVVAEPPCALGIDEQTLVIRAVGSWCEWRELPVAVQNHNIPFLDAVPACTVQIGCADMCIGLQEINVHIDCTSHECGQWKVTNRFPILKMMVRTLAVGSQMCGQIQRCVEIRNRAACVVADQMTSSGLCCRIQDLC